MKTHILRKKHAVIIIFLVFCVPVFAAGRLVLDVSNLLQAVLSYTEKISEVSQEISYWKTQYDLIARAAKGLVSGDFSAVLRSISSISGRTSRMKGVSGSTKDILASLSNDSLNLLDLYQSVDGLNYSAITEAISNKIETMKELHANGFTDFSYTGSGWDDLVTYGNSIFDIGSLLTTYVARTNDTGESGLELVEELLTVRRNSEKVEALKALKQNLENEVGTTEEIQKTIQKLQNQYNSKREEYENLTTSDSTQMAQAELQLQELEKEISEYEELRDQINEINGLINEYNKKARAESLYQYERNLYQINEKSEEVLKEAISENIETKSKNMQKALYAEPENIFL